MKTPIEDIDLLLSFKFFNTLEMDDERICREYYASRGYFIVSTINKKILKKALDNFKGLNISIGSGIPDFFVYNNSEYFFVEAKSGNYFLKQNQIEWIIRNHQKVVIFWLRKPRYNIYLDE